MRVRARATLTGSVAVLMWATLALLTASSGKVPPFQLIAMAFALASLMVLAKWLVRGEPILSYLRQPPAAWALGVAGLFGYHFFSLLSG